VGLILLIPLATAPNTVGPNYKNVTVRTQVNITNARPDIMNVTIYELTNISNRNITLSAGGFKEIICNATVRDWNGYNDVILVNATLFHQSTSSHNATDNNNTHYTNSNCTNSGNGAGFYVNYACNFTVIYYANNGTWVCNVTAMDNQSTTGYGQGLTTFFPVYALNVTDGIDYGGVAVEAFSNNVSANITNLGNMAINVTVQGYGARLNDGLAMNCSLNGNITIANQRFFTSDVDWPSMITMTGGSQLLPNLTMPKQNNSQLITNSTFWQLYIDSANGPGGNCSGYVLFTAVAP
jgi:hypothetical protein